MTYIKLTNNMDLTVTKSGAIYRGDNMSKSIIFLLPTQVEELNLDTSTVFLCYIRADGEPDMVILERSDKYNEFYDKYTLPVTCKLSRYPGQICMWLNICAGDATSPVIAKSGECTILIRESKSIDGMCDHQLTAVYQLKKKIDKLTNDNDDGDEWEDMDPSDSSCDCEGDCGDIWEEM